MLTVDEVKELLAELDGELPVLDDGERLADRQRVLALVSEFVREWTERGYNYQQIAEKLRDKGVIRASQKTVREMVEGRRRKRRVKTQTSRTEEAASNGVVTQSDGASFAGSSEDKKSPDRTVKRAVEARSVGSSQDASSASKNGGGKSPALTGGKTAKRTDEKQPAKTSSGIVPGSGRFVPREDSDEL